jgi:hypothetical protein
MSMWCGPPGLSGGFYFLDHMSLKKLFLRLTAMSLALGEI